MAPLETLNDEERQYHEVRNDTVENLQKVASLIPASEESSQGMSSKPVTFRKIRTRRKRRLS